MIGTRTLCALALAFVATAAWAQDRVVYHIDNAAAQGLKGLRNVRNATAGRADQRQVATHVEPVGAHVEVDGRVVEIGHGNLQPEIRVSELRREFRARA